MFFLSFPSGSAGQSWPSLDLKHGFCAADDDADAVDDDEDAADDDDCDDIDDDDNDDYVHFQYYHYH